MAYLLTLGVRIYAQDHNSLSWACSSAVHNCPVKGFEVEMHGDLVQFNVKSKARLCRAVLVTCVHFRLLFGGNLVLPTISHTHTLPSFSYPNGFSLCSSLGEE